MPSVAPDLPCLMLQLRNRPDSAPFSSASKLVCAAFDWGDSFLLPWALSELIWKQWSELEGSWEARPADLGGNSTPFGHTPFLSLTRAHSVGAQGRNTQVFLQAATDRPIPITAPGYQELVLPQSLIVVCSFQSIPQGKKLFKTFLPCSSGCPA